MWTGYVKRKTGVFQPRGGEGAALKCGELGPLLTHGSECAASHSGPKVLGLHPDNTNKCLNNLSGEDEKE